METYIDALQRGDLKPSKQLTKEEMIERINFLNQMNESLFDAYPMEFGELREEIEKEEGILKGKICGFDRGREIMKIFEVECLLMEAVGDELEKEEMSTTEQLYFNAADHLQRLRMHLQKEEKQKDEDL